MMNPRRLSIQAERDLRNLLEYLADRSLTATYPAYSPNICPPANEDRGRLGPFSRIPPAIIYFIQKFLVARTSGVGGLQSQGDVAMARSTNGSR